MIGINQCVFSEDGRQIEAVRKWDGEGRSCSIAVPKILFKVFEKNIQG